jgi:hypothetical protein
MTRLADLIEIRHRNVRSVNLDEDLGDLSALVAYSPGAHVLDALRRLASGLQDGRRTRAWSITGPYGAGKSSFAVLLAGLLAADDQPVRRGARELLAAVDPQLSEMLDRERQRLDVADGGMIAAVAVGAREPTVRALLRALHRGGSRWWSSPGPKPRVLRELDEAVSAGRDDPELLLRSIDQLASYAPLLIVVDELGKTLEFAADRSGEGDLFVLQQLAERLSGAERFEGMVVTLQHLAFEEYLVGAGEARRREWRKVHGRFEDVPFVSDSAHALRLIAEALGATKPRSAGQRAIVATARAAEAALSDAVGHLRPPSAITGGAERTYPLHPSVALALPPLVARLGQHDRSLVSFIASDAPHGLRAFLSEQTLRSGHSAPIYRLSDLYDYFFEDGAMEGLAGASNAQAREISARIEGARELDELTRRVLKTIAVLNLTAGADGLTANIELIVESTLGPDAGKAERHQVEVALERLVEHSLVVFRRFAGEYRVWEGSDFDIVGESAAAREQLSVDDGRLILDTVARAHPLRAAVAQRHSQRQHILRYFDVRFATPERFSGATSQLPGADGLLLWVLAGERAPEQVPASTADGLPLVVLWSPFGAEITEIALDAGALEAVLRGAPELENDPVARRELRYRLGAVQDALGTATADAFALRRRGVVCFAKGEQQQVRDHAGLSRLLSDICDERYARTPVIRNEMLNRRELTSQGAKARRLLLERMFTAEHRERLGIEGYGPERAMYEAVLRHTGLHGVRDGEWCFGPPGRDSPLADVWQTLMEFFDEAVDKPRGIDELYRTLLEPPFGLKEGPIPVLLAAALQHRADDVFIYQEGTFQPVVEPAHIERLLKAPERFAVKRASLLGVRGAVFARLRALMSTRADDGPAGTRNTSTLAVVRPLIAFASALPQYSQQTSSISPQASAVCQALLGAREPDVLLFEALPAALGLEPLALDAPHDRAADRFVAALRVAMSELSSAYERLLDRIGELLRDAFASQHRVKLREDLRARSRRLTGQVIDPKLRAFLLQAANEEIDDAEWLEALGMTLASKPPQSWTDHDVVVFEALVAERARWFARLERLHFEMLQRDEVGFDARKLTLTAPDGTEHYELVSVDPETVEIVADALATALTDVSAKLGERHAAKALLGALALKVLTPSAQASAEPVRLTKHRKRKSA